MKYFVYAIKSQKDSTITGKPFLQKDIVLMYLYTKRNVLIEYQHKYGKNILSPE